MGLFDNDSNDNGGFFGGRPKKKKGLFDGFFGDKFGNLIFAG